MGTGTMEGYDVNETMVILENAEGRFILGHKYDNCISIGSIPCREYERLEDALLDIAQGKDIKDMDEAWNETDIIRKLRKKTGLSQKKFGERYGIPERTIQDWERDRRKPTAYVIEMLSRIVQAEELIPVTYYYEEAFDGGECKFFNNDVDAIKYAKETTNNLSDHMKEKIKSEGGFVQVTLTELEWDEQMMEYYPKENGWIKDVWNWEE